MQLIARITHSHELLTRTKMRIGRNRYMALKAIVEKMIAIMI